MKDFTGHLKIDLGALKSNYRFLQEQVGDNCSVGAAVKAQAYGLGTLEVVGALVKEGAQDFFVANLDEAIELRTAYKDITLYVLNGFYKNHAPLYLEHRLIPALDSLPEIKDYRDFAAQAGKALPAALHFNTRMNRLGLGASEQEKLWGDMSALDGLDITLVMSHLACADDQGHELNETQAGLFKDIAARFPHIRASLANSSGIFLGRDLHYDLVRPGASLYGVNPTPNKPNPMKSVVTLSAPIIKTRTVYEGAHIGYNATYRFEKDSPVACLSIGYADGIFRSLSNKGAFYWNGIRCPIRGRVSMDLISVDLSDVPEGERPKQGDFMEVLGPHQNVDDLARDAGTIGYEILTSLGRRYERVYES